METNQSFDVLSDFNTLFELCQVVNKAAAQESLNNADSITMDARLEIAGVNHG